MPVRVFAFASQPWKAIYLAYALFTVPFIRLPYWITLAAIPPLRPIRSWTFTRTLIFYVSKFGVHVMYQVGFSLSASPERESKNPDASGFV
jgi:hypothetical protein